ncbi:MAG: tRNA (5-methylaminomethyl-2-thiouridine)(34)-methyltransferase MnmD [Planctomycetota bacterium]
MPPPDRPRHRSALARYDWIVTDDGSHTLEDLQLGETFHSGCGAVAESWHVYVCNSGLRRLIAANRTVDAFEYGLGTGTAFLLTAAWAEANASQLNYCAVEKELLAPQVLRRLPIEVGLAGLEDQACHALSEQIGKLHTAFCDALDSAPPTAGWLHVQLSKFVNLNLWLGDACKFSAAKLAEDCPQSFDSVYFDPFSPESNPELWQPEVYRNAWNLLKPAGVLTSYCVKGVVRRDMQSAGFDVTKVAGPPSGKREVLVATKI